MRTSIQPIHRPAPAAGLRASSLDTASSLQPLAAGIAITLYAAWNARELLGAWLHSPFDRCDSLAFALWIVPIAAVWAAGRRLNHTPRVSIAPFAFALALSFAGVAADFSALKYAAFAIALGGFLPLRRATYLWLGCAAAWMPVAGWVFSSHGPVAVNATRVAIGLVAALPTPLFLRHASLR